jgi:hypothetical protein
MSAGFYGRETNPSTIVIGAKSVVQLNSNRIFI